MLVREADKVIHHVADDRPGRAAKRLDELLKTSHLRNSSDMRRFYSVASFHSMSIEALSLENQVINLWIGFETISPSHPLKTKIDTVVNAALPCICLRYIERLLSQAAADLLKWDRKRALEALRNASENEGGTSLARSLAALLTLPELERELEALFTELASNELLRFRLYRLHNALKSPAEAIEFMNGHEERVQWQLRRIYRSRNAIVHRGRRPTFVHAIVDSAHFYLDQIIQLTNELSCGTQGFSRYEEMFNYVGAEYEALKRGLRNCDTFTRATLPKLMWARPQLKTPKELLA